MSARILVAGLCLVLGLCGCEEPPPPTPYPVTFLAVADPGEALAGVTIAAGGMNAVTDATGMLSVELQGPEGSTVPITATCPEGHRLAVAPAPLVLRRVIDLTTGMTAALQVSIACPPMSRHGVVVVRASGEGSREGIPVMIDGREVARTDRSGVAHVALEMAPGSAIQVQLATSTVMPLLRPADPSMPFTFRDADDIFVFDREFESEEPPAAPRRRGRRRAAAPSAPTIHIPTRLGGGR
jgi:hypothetical protein